MLSNRNIKEVAQNVVKHHLELLLAVASILAVQSAMAEHASKDDICPANIRVEQKLTSDSRSWMVVSDKSISELKSITFYEGPPKEKVSLIYDDIRTNKDTEIAIWKFRSISRGVWVKCDYENTNIALSKELEKTISGCKVTYSKDITIGGSALINAIACK